MDRRSSQVICLLMATLFTELSGLQWSQETQKANVIYVCSGGTLALPWNVTVTAGDIILDIQWFHSGRSEEVIAVLAHGNFMPMPAYAGRARQTTNAGIAIDHVTIADSGNYSVEILGREPGSATVKSLSTAVMVRVADGLQTRDERLHVTSTPAEYNKTTNQYHVVLSCGNFTYPAQPPFQVWWLTPSGEVLPSSRYQEGIFYLVLSNPVQKGLYTCRVPATSACLPDNRTGEATINLDTVEANVAVLMAQVRLLTLRVSFSATLSEDVCTGDVAGCNVTIPLVLPNVLTNVGNGYNATTGRFIAPVSGIYCFMASTETSNLSNYAKLELNKNNVIIAYVSMQDDNHYGTGSLHAVRHLTAGDSVNLYAKGGLYSYMPATSFSGFLIAADP